MADDNPSSLEDLKEELSFQRILYDLIDNNVPEPEQARQKVSTEIERLHKAIREFKKNQSTSAPNSTPKSSRLTDPFASSPPIDLSDHTMGDPSAARDMELSIGIGRKRSNLDLSPSGRDSKSRRTTPSSMTPDTDEDLATSSYVNRQKEQEARLAREAEDAEFARTLSEGKMVSNVPTASSSTNPDGYNAFDRLGGRLPSQVPGPRPTIKPEPSTKSFIKPEPNMGSKGMGDWRNAIELTSDSSDLEEIDAAGFQSNGRKPSAPKSSSRRAADTPIDLTRNMDGSLVQSNPIGQAARLYGQQHAGANSIGINSYPSYNRGLDVPSALAGVEGTSVYGSGTYAPSTALPGGLLPAIGAGLISAGKSIGGGLVSAANSLSNAVFDLDGGLDDDGNPLNPKMAHLYSAIATHDPSKNKKDILDLLSHIQNDLDMDKENRRGTPDGLKYPLYEYQKIALSWMIRSEESRGNRGGILADDMGLGKTISTLALLQARPSEDPARKTTLIVGPVALVRQWKTELETKLNPRYRMSTFLYHGTKASWDQLRNYQIVLTTYGTLAAELKRLTLWEGKLKANPSMDQSDTTKNLPLLGPKSKWYRVILDEAQCIKNKQTATARACCLLQSTYRFCLTGTPMMNNVGELYSLIHFLRIKPYNDWANWRDDFGCLSAKNTGDYTYKQAMSKLQTVIKAILLRRTKNSLIDGKPILTLPEKIEETQHVVFDEEEQAYYTALETKQQLAFNRYRKAGTIGKNYASVLVLLLRLRQAACHPHLIFDYEEAPSSADITVEEMVKLAESLTPDVVTRIMAAEAFECPVCYDPVLNPRLVVPCGHDTCSECLVKIFESGHNEAIAEGDENSAAKCPTCRGPVKAKKVIDYATFKKVYIPSPEDTMDTESDPDSDSDLDSDSDGVSVVDDSDDTDLKDFIVPDDFESEGEAEDEDEDDEIEMIENGKVKAEVKDEFADSSDLEDFRPAKPTSKETSKTSAFSKAKRAESKKARKAKKPKDVKGKGKSKEDSAKKHLNLAVLRKESTKSREHMKKYKRYLKKNYVPSAKITKCVELLVDAKKRGTKTIVFSQFTALLDLIEVQLEQEGLNHERYDGTMSADARHTAVLKFTKSPNCHLFLVSLKAGNSGLNLVEASNVIIMDPFWNPYIEMQAVDRAHRIGQQNVVQVHRIIVKGTVEDRILELQERKRNLVESALDENASRQLARLGQQELIYLFNGGNRGAANTANAGAD